MDPVYGFQAVNVEAQLRTPTSLLRWLHRFIALRKEHPVFGFGTYEPIEPVEPAHLRAHPPLRGRHRPVRPQPRPLRPGGRARPRARIEGRYPVELFGRSRFPRIGELPYLLTLAPRGFFWFQLVEEERSPTMSEAVQITADEIRRALDEEELRDWVQHQRWYASKAAQRDRDRDRRERRRCATTRCCCWRSCRRGSPPARTSSTSCRSRSAPTRRATAPAESIAQTDDVDRVRRARRARARRSSCCGGSTPATRSRPPTAAFSFHHVDGAEPQPSAGRRPSARWASSSPTPRSCSTTGSC